MVYSDCTSPLTIQYYLDYPSLNSLLVNGWYPSDDRYYGEKKKKWSWHKMYQAQPVRYNEISHYFTLTGEEMDGSRFSFFFITFFFLTVHYYIKMLNLWISNRYYYHYTSTGIINIVWEKKLFGATDNGELYMLYTNTHTHIVMCITNNI